VKNALIIFVRNPELGKVKTRLAAQIGKEEALAVYIKLLEHTQEICNSISADKYLFGTENENDVCWDGFLNAKQQGENLGSRMQNAFEKLFVKGYEKIIIIGSDCPTLTSDNIEKAMDELENKDAVIGPAEDGGYYLLGLKKMYANLFQTKLWSTSTVYEDTIKDFKNLSLKYYILPVLSDVDEAKDIPQDWLQKIM
jgi:hypothetical protein